LISRCDSAAIVPKTSELLPEPETPVNAVSRRFGMSPPAAPVYLIARGRPQADAASHANPSGSAKDPASPPMTIRWEPVPSGETPASLARARRP
jgi:hypothetical protein